MFQPSKMTSWHPSSGVKPVGDAFCLDPILPNLAVILFASGSRSSTALSMNIPRILDEARLFVKGAKFGQKRDFKRFEQKKFLNFLEKKEKLHHL